MKVTVKIEGAVELGRYLEALPVNVRKRAVRPAIRLGAVPVKSAVEVHAPVAPGAPDLRAHIAVSGARSRFGDVATVAIGPTSETRGDTDVRYDLQGFYNEYGTAKMDQQAFMRPSVDEQGPTAVQIVMRSLWGFVSAFGGARARSTGGGLT